MHSPFQALHLRGDLQQGGHLPVAAAPAEPAFGLPDLAVRLPEHLAAEPAQPTGHPRKIEAAATAAADDDSERACSKVRRT